MSHAVIKGKPNDSQLYLDAVLDGARKSLNGDNLPKDRRDVNLAEILYYSLKKRLEDVYMINGATGEKITNRQILSRAVPLARALADKYEAGTIVMFVMRNHQHMAVVYYASFFANVIPLPIEPNSTLHELRHFIILGSPSMVFCDHDRYKDVKTIVNELKKCVQTTPVIIKSNDNVGLEEFYRGHSSDLESFQVSQASAKSEALLIPTSGSSGLPKATVLTHGGLVAQQPTLWTHSKLFPKPTKLVLLLSTAQWLTHNTLMFSCPIYGVTLLMTPHKATVDHVLQITETFHPTCTLLEPNFANSLASSATPNQLSSLETIVFTGAPLTENIVETLKVSEHSFFLSSNLDGPCPKIQLIFQGKLSKTASLKNGMGMTETHGFITMPAANEHWSSNGHILNIMQYKIVSEDGKELGPNQQGELYLKSDLCIFKTYYKNEEAHNDVVSDGWFKTGDVFYEDDNQELYFVERKKFWFKYMNYHIAPEEVERVISSVPGVHECVVVDSEMGPAAAVVKRTDCSIKEDDIRKNINTTVESTLSDYKRLRGGIVFFTTLPCTHSGKINRSECNKLVKNLSLKGASF